MITRNGTATVVTTAVAWLAPGVAGLSAADPADASDCSGREFTPVYSVVLDASGRQPSSC